MMSLKSGLTKVIRWWTPSRVVGLLLIFALLSPLYMYFSHDVARLNTEWPVVVIEGDDVNYVWQKNPPKYWVKLNQISSYAKWAVILSEDWSFYEHQGVDYEELRKALDESVKERRLVRGASTISQQVTKNVFLSSSRTIVRKLHEMILTQRMEKSVSKSRILETYFNIVELGPKIYGIKQASYYYFKKHPSALNPREGAFIAMLLPSPKKYSVSFRQKRLTRFARSRVNAILTKLRWGKVLTPEERDAWAASRFDWEN